MISSSTLVALLFLASVPTAAAAWTTHPMRRVVVSSSGRSTFPPLPMISGWGIQGNPALKKKTPLDPVQYIQDYLPEPGPVEARARGLEGTLVVSLSRAPDQFLLDLLNHQDSAFAFTNITVVCDDPVKAKKRLLSRSARYTGLLDKLHVVKAAPAESGMAEPLQGASSWLVVLEEEEEENGDQAFLEQCAAIGRSAAAAAGTLQHVAILVAGVNEWPPSVGSAAIQALQPLPSQHNIAYTIVAVGHLDDTRPEGSAAYQYDTLGNHTLPGKATFSREEAYRLVTELLQLECGVNQALVFAEVYNPNATEVKLIKGLREAGYARPQEIDHMIRSGPSKYREAIQKFRTEHPDAALGYTTDAWWEAPEYKLSRQRSDERMAATAQAVKDARTIEIEQVAKEWAKREYFRAALAGTVENDMTEEEYITSVWDRAMFEGDIKYRQSKGEVVDTSLELATFQAQQERKQQVMLQRAKAELARVLQEDDTADMPKEEEEEEDDEDDDDE